MTKTLVGTPDPPEDDDFGGDDWGIFGQLRPSKPDTEYTRDLSLADVVRLLHDIQADVSEIKAQLDLFYRRWCRS